MLHGLECKNLRNPMYRPVIVLVILPTLAYGTIFLENVNFGILLALTYHCWHFLLRCLSAHVLLKFIEQSQSEVSLALFFEIINAC